MKAIVQPAYGSADVLRLEAVDKPIVDSAAPTLENEHATGRDGCPPSRCERSPPRGRFRSVGDDGQVLGEMTFSRARDDLIINDLAAAAALVQLTQATADASVRRPTRPSVPSRY